MRLLFARQAKGKRKLVLWRCCAIRTAHRFRPGLFDFDQFKLVSGSMIPRPNEATRIQSTTSLEVAAKYALLSLDATMRSNVTVGPPFDLLLYKNDSLEITRYRRVSAGDRDLNLIHSSWEQSLRRPVEQLPDIEFQSLGSEKPAQSIREVAHF